MVPFSSEMLVYVKLHRIKSKKALNLNIHSAVQRFPD